MLGVPLCLVSASCVSRKTEPAALPTAGFVSQETIAHACRQRTVHRRGESGFEMLPDGLEAYTARLAMIEAAQRTLDLQYFIWKDDMVGTIVADRLLAAADRGVKVRLLLDVANSAQSEVRSAALAAHPNIRVAFFNPMTSMKGIFVGNPVPVLGEIDRMQSRMHNKIMVVDGTILVGGGRNLADEYFGVSRHHNVRDLDFFAMGSVVNDSLKSYDLYWRSSLTYVSDPLKLTEHDYEELRELRSKIARKKRALAKKNGSGFPASLSRSAALSTLSKFAGRMVWARYEFISDPPERMLRQGKVASPVYRSIEKALRDADAEIIMHAAYFIPEDDTLKMLRDITGDGVKVRVLTNSLASIDGVSAMSGIANRREDILDSGILLSEMRGRPQVRKDYLHTPKLTPLGMHSKGFVSDNDISFIGSYNMDPRSKYINTETGVVIYSPAFAARLKSYLKVDLQPQNCWQVKRDDMGRVCWISQRPGRAASVHHRDPDVPFQRRVSCWILRLLPWEDLL